MNGAELFDLVKIVLNFV